VNLAEVFSGLEEKVSCLGLDEGESNSRQEDSFLKKRRELLETACLNLADTKAQRLREEFDGWGPLAGLFKLQNITEILINSPTEIWFECGGRLQKSDDRFFSLGSHQRIVDRLAQEAGAFATIEHPSANGRWRDFRVHLIRPPLTKGHSVVSLRRHPENPWTLESLRETAWCTKDEADFLRTMVRSQKNFLVIGATGSGKTSVVNALLREISPNERAIIVEDTDEIALPPGPSTKILTRSQTAGGLAAVDQGELVRQSLRMRPDRLVMGEVRGDEAKDFLMALSTGHAGSFGTLHAEDPAQALLRLEMLVQMGAPHWSLTAIRKLIRFGIQQIVVTGKNKNGERRLMGIHRLVSLEDTGFLLEKEEPARGF
jgi:pilus assembly protein CpaF